MERKPNPWESNLAGRDALQVISNTPSRLQRLFEDLGPEAVEKPRAPGKWSAREIFCHFADGEVVFAFRLRQVLAEDFHVIQPYDQDKWAATYAAYDAQTALSVFSSIRRWNILLIKAAGHAALSKSLNHPERGNMTFQVVVETMAGHDINHLKQVEEIAAIHRPARP